MKKAKKFHRSLLAVHSSATRTFFLKPIIHVITPFYIDPLFKNKSFLTQKYLVEGLSARQIAKEIFSSKMAVIAALHRFGIPVRKPHHHNGNPSQLRFGQKFKKRKLVEHRKEQRIIELVRNLHAQGLSLRQIARILNDAKVATENRGRRWHQEMVRRILLNLDRTNN